MGVMMFCLLNNKFPFHYDSDKQLYNEHMTPNFIKSRYIKKFPDDLCDLQEKFFVINEAARINMTQVLQHPWILRRGK